jgi:hypothetical protein
MKNCDDTYWLLDRINYCVKETKRRKEISAPGWGSSRKFIFLGSYDVWYSESDRLQNIQIITDRLNKAKEAGLITNKLWQYGENWYLTDAGREYLNKKGEV